jgi:hypothetical protein
MSEKLTSSNNYDWSKYASTFEYYSSQFLPNKTCFFIQTTFVTILSTISHNVEWYFCALEVNNFYYHHTKQEDFYGH